MIKLNHYINEAWGGVKKHTNIENIKAWCEEMGIRNYTINNKGEIDVDGGVNLDNKDFEELPYKFSRVTEYFSLVGCKNLTSLKNCPDYVISGSFSCSYGKKLESLEGCPKKVGGNFYCNSCKHEFTKKEVESLCKVNGTIIK